MIVALAPMDGITNNAYRLICKQVWDRYNTAGRLAIQDKVDGLEFFMFTEFMSADGYVHQPSRLVKHLVKSGNQSPIIAQIYGWDQDSLVKTAIDIDNKYDFDGIELNIWCPSPKIMACEAGSGMLKNRPKTLEIIKQISSSIKKPFSIKTRCGLTQDDKDDQFAFVLEASQYVSMITIHGRTYKQSHNGDVDRDWIYKLKSTLVGMGRDDIKIIWNGGISDVVDGYNKIWNLDGMMLGQAAMCNPWSLVWVKPDTQELYTTIWDHLYLSLANEFYFYHQDHFDHEKNLFTQPMTSDLDQIISDIKKWSYDHLDSEWKSLMEFRKHLFWYVSGFPNNREFKTRIAQIKSLKWVVKETEEFMQTVL